ncbi:HNH endonuclease [uncultured Nitratireductor sp.]|uniref:HNH endonuclease n=1 Tax=uncultured Nitratireductor sp. TaxID=520953 RepID=UPI00345A7761
MPWSECESDAERLDVHNGFLLSALWDAAFDRGLVTFSDDGKPEFSPQLSEAGRRELRWSSPIPLTDDHRSRLSRHRARVRTSA